MASPPFAHLDPRPYALPEDFAQRFLTPALAVFPEQVRANLAGMASLLGGDLDRWRCHVKTTKIPRVFEELDRAGLRSFKAATVREARCLLETLRDRGSTAVDVCLAHPLRGAALGHLGRLAAAFPDARLSVLVEDPAALDQVPPGVGVFLDLNSGMHRTGIPLEQHALLERLVRTAGDRLRGLHFYDGHLHGPDLAERRLQAFAGYERLLELHRALGLDGRGSELVTSGTTTFHLALEYPGFADWNGGVHRVSPGTVVYHDLRSELENPGLPLRPAALVVSQIISHPCDDLATCDAGSKSLAAEAGDPCAHVLGHGDWRAERPSEEHLPIRIPGEPLPERGSLLTLVPRHVCPTVNLAEEAVLIEGGRVLGTFPVRARAHDLRAD